MLRMFEIIKKDIQNPPLLQSPTKKKYKNNNNTSKYVDMKGSFMYSACHYVFLHLSPPSLSPYILMTWPTQLRVQDLNLPSTV
jgi:hypothetical protein